MILETSESLVTQLLRIERGKEYMLSENNVEIVTPIKRSKGQKQLPYCRLYSVAVSGGKQAIKSFNNWLIVKTDIQSASKVRSVSGLIAFVFARIACVCSFLTLDWRL